MDAAIARTSERALGVQDVAQRLAKSREPSRTVRRAEAGEWSIQYIAAATNTEARLKLLEQMRTAASPPGEVEAELIAVDAVRGSPVQIRNAARAVIDRFSATPAVVNAMLDVAPQIPFTPENAKLVGAVTLVDVPVGKDRNAWSLAVRRALVQRLLDVLSGAGDAGVIEELSGLYAETLAQSVNDASSGVPSPTTWPNPSPDADVSARLITEEWKRQAARLAPSGREPVRTDEIDRKWRGRLNLARGPVQRTVAHRLATAEFIAYVVVAERSSRHDAAAAVLGELSLQRRASTHVLLQLAAAERAILKLWAIRLELGSSEVVAPIEVEPVANPSPPLTQPADTSAPPSNFPTDSETVPQLQPVP